MDIILWLVLGAVAGILAVIAIYRTLPANTWQWGGAVAIGVLGGWLGGWVTGLIGLDAVNWLGSLVVAFVSAVLVLLLLRRVMPSR
ncbi:MAG: GlsB/YeaQ/YmgE family stress response membrane protein [Sphaerobacter sp.]|nr:GlsB/YeaQ/YmgE family stress response membrane protein [Sphaerobacter sp.]